MSGENRPRTVTGKGERLQKHLQNSQKNLSEVYPDVNFDFRDSIMPTENFDIEEPQPKDPRGRLQKHLLRSSSM